ncbi:hypothetical protein AQUCO_01400733v1, partial [Aquilegia coerulea]
MPSQKKNLSVQQMLSAAGPYIAMAMLIQPYLNELFPSAAGGFHYKGLVVSSLKKFLTRFSSQMTMVIEEFNDLTTNQIYSAAERYFHSKSLTSTHRFRISKDEHHQSYGISTEIEEEIVDVFEGIQFKWKFMNGSHILQAGPKRNSSQGRSEDECFGRSFHKKHKEKVLNSYLPYTLNMSKALEIKKTRVVKLFRTRNMHGSYGGGGAWCCINLDHPATFDKLAMDEALKRMIIDDLDRFVKRKEFYRRVSRAWKCGYLLYGPPGTGKSRLIAAMANYLNFDIYDLELTDLRSNWDLRRLLLSTGNRSILVLEDIDCSFEFKNSRQLLPGNFDLPPGVHKIIAPQQLTLSGMLNCIDGLWSSTGDERIIVFTTNNKDMLDPALLRPGRMDVHIHMSFCTPSGFRLLAYNYLMVSDHPIFREIEQLLEIQ